MKKLILIALLIFPLHLVYLIVNQDHFLLNNKIVSNVKDVLKTEFPTKLPPMLLIADSQALSESVCIAMDAINDRGTELLIVRGTDGYDSRN